MAVYTKSSSNIASGLLSGCSIGGTDVGYLGGKFSIKCDISNVELTSGCTHSPVATLQKSKKFSLDVSLAEYTFLNVATALGQLVGSVGSSGSYLLLHSTQSTSAAIVIEYQNEQEGVYHKWTLPACKLSSGGTVSYDAENQGFMDLTFDVLADANDHYGTCTKAATSSWA